MMVLVGYAFAIAIGFSLGLLGGGGSVLALPVLVYVMGVPTKPAIASTLVVVGTVSLLGVIPHWRRGKVNLKTAAVFGSATSVGAFAGAKLAALPFVTEGLQMTIFAIAMLVAAWFTIRRSSPPPTASVPPELAAYPRPVCKYCWLWLLTEGMGVGLLTGLVGVGGGFAIVPALVLLANVPMAEAIGTSLLVIAANSAIGFLGYLGTVSLDPGLLVSFTFFAAIGTVGGSYASQFVPARVLQKGFGYFLVAIATFVLFQNRASFFPPTPVERSEVERSARQRVERPNPRL